MFSLSSLQNNTDLSRYKFALKLLVLCAFFLLIVLNTDFSLIRQELLHVKPEYLLYSVILSVLIIFLGSERFRFILNSYQIQKSSVDLFFIKYYGQFIDNFFFGFLGGDAYKYIAIKGDKKNVFKSIILDRVTGLIVLTFLAIPGGLFLVLQFSKDLSFSLFNLLPIALVGIITVSLASYILIRKYKEKATNILNFFWKNISVLKDGRLLFLAFVIQLLMVCNLFMVFEALSWSIPFWQMLIFVPFMNLVTNLPLSIKGHGIRELLIVILFSQSIETILAFTIVNTALTIFHTGLFALMHSLRS